MLKMAEGILSEDKRKDPKRVCAQTLAITSGKGGVGKSFLALNLGLKLAQLDQKVLVLDLDFGLANISLMANLNPTCTIEDVLKGECELAEAIITYSYLDILPGGCDIKEIDSFSGETMNKLHHLLSEMEKSYDFILIDNQAGISPFALSFLLRSEKIMLILVPQLTSIANGYALFKFILSKNSSKDVMTLWNMVSSQKEAYQLKEKFDLLCHTFLERKTKNLGWILEDDEVEKSIAKQIPLIIRSPFSQAASCMNRIAFRMIGEKHSTAKSNLRLRQEDEAEVK